jgi:hypothetical protein
MFDDTIDPYDTGLRELTRRLEAFADTRLSPSLSGTTRMRTSVMNAAHRRAALIAADATFGSATATAPVTVPAIVAERSPFASRAWRRPAAALMAGCLTLTIVGGTVSAATAGGPLYAARIWIEMANLPAGAIARADAEVTRLDARLQEMQEAYATGDGPAAEAALAAYSVILSEAVQGSAGDPAASAAIESNLTRHVAVLTALIDNVPAAAQDAIRHALSSSTTVLQELDDAIVRGGGDGLSGAGPAEGKPVPPTTSDGTAPNASARPEKAPTPDKGGHSHGNGGTPPGQLQPRGTSHPDPTPRPTDKPTGPDKSGGT